MIIVFTIPGRLLLITFILVTVCLLPIQSAQAIDCDAARKWYDDGIALSDHSERESACYKKAIELCPELFEAHNKLGEIYLSWGEYDLAIHCFETAARAPLYSEANYNLAETYKRLNQFTLAAAQYRETIRKAPDHRRAHNGLKYVNKRLGVYDHVLDGPPQPKFADSFTIISGVTLPQGGTKVDMNLAFWRSQAPSVEGIQPSRKSSQPARKGQITLIEADVLYGLTNDLMIGIAPKWFSRRLELGLFTLEENRPAKIEVHGFGDTAIVSKYRLWGQRDNHLSVFHLLSVPTGDAQAKDDDLGVRKKLPMGSGGFDFTPGIAFTAKRDDLSIHTNIRYTYTTGWARADEFRFDIGAALPGIFNYIAGIELNYRWRGDMAFKQMYQEKFYWVSPDASSPNGPWTFEDTVIERGGHSLFVSPYAHSFFGEGYRFTLGLQIPVYSNPHGWQEVTVFRMGISKTLG